jgi:hypothetical protein
VAAVSRGQKLLYGAVFVLAAWVGAWGFFAPAQVEWALPWPVPPLHARFLGAMYFSGATFMVGALLARHWSSIRVVVPMISLWTGTLFVVSLFYLPTFDFGRPQAWIWFAAYVVFPIAAAWIAWRMRSNADRGGGPSLPAGLRAYLTLQGAAVTLLAAGLLLFPGTAVRLWPWAISPLLTQMYGAPFLSYGLGSLYAARQSTRSEVLLFLVGTLVFAVGVLVASVLHLSLFAPASPSARVWFGGFGLAALALAAWSLPPLWYRRDHNAVASAGREAGRT